MMPTRPSLCRQGPLTIAAPGLHRSGWPVDVSRGSRHARGYDRHWVSLRAAKLAADPLCEDCLLDGRTTAATDVHHIAAFRGRDDPLRLDAANLRSLCPECHHRRTGRCQDGKVGRAAAPPPPRGVDILAADRAGTGVLPRV
jgi:5-methylcytosine-specific restriction protein A